MKQPPPQMKFVPPQTFTKMSVSCVTEEGPTMGFAAVVVSVMLTLTKGWDGSPQQKK